MQLAENACWDLAKKGKIFGLEKRKKSSPSNDDDNCPMSYLLLILSMGEKAPGCTV